MGFRGWQYLSKRVRRPPRLAYSLLNAERDELQLKPARFRSLMAAWARPPTARARRCWPGWQQTARLSRSRQQRALRSAPELASLVPEFSSVRSLRARAISLRAATRRHSRARSVAGSG